MFYEELSDRLELPGEVRELMASIRAKVGGMEKYQDRLFAPKYPVGILMLKLHCLARKKKIHPYSLDFYLLFVSAKRLLELYKQRGIDEAVFWNSIMDLKYKLHECKNVRGVWGTFVFWWFPNFYRLIRFGLGRFQYDVSKYHKKTYEKNGVTVNRGDVAFNFHIPSAGPLTEEMRMDSYKKAYEFFGEKPLVLFCHSWLLFPGNREFFPPTSRILDFMDDFDIIHSRRQLIFWDAWRIFGTNKRMPPDKLPAETSLQRAYIERLKKKEPVGAGFGIIVFDGEKIINK